MHRLIAAAMIVTGATLSSPAQAQIVGDYTVRGGCAGQPEYTGKLSVERSGVLYRLTWVIGRDTFYGTGIEQNGGLAIAFASQDWKGVMSARATGDRWKGVWSIYNSGAICTEAWER